MADNAAMAVEVYEDTEKLPKSNVWQVRLPQVLAIEPCHWDQDTYMLQKEEEKDEAKKNRSFDATSTIRWRWTTDEHGNKKRISNARLVRWSDNSLQLMIGNEELYDVDVHRPSAAQHSYLFTTINQGSTLQAQAKLQQKFTFQAASAKSKENQRKLRGLATKVTKERSVKMVNASQVHAQASEHKKRRKERNKLNARKPERLNRYQKVTTAFIEHGMDDDDGVRNDSRWKQNRSGETPLARLARDRQRNKRAREDDEMESFISYGDSDDNNDDDDNSEEEEEEEEEESEEEEIDDDERDRRVLKAKHGSPTAHRRKKQKVTKDDDVLLFDDESTSTSTTTTITPPVATGKARRAIVDSDEESE